MYSALLTITDESTNTIDLENVDNFAVLKLIEILILWVYYIIPFGFSLFRHIWDIIFQPFSYFLGLRITDEGSIPEMRIWSILKTKSDLKWCIHLSRSLYSN